MENISVPGFMRNLSSMEFYKNAIYLRRDLTDWMMRDFGAKRTKKSVQQVIKDIDAGDQQMIDDVFAKYGKQPNQEFTSTFPSWFVDFERNILIQLIHNLVADITAANSIYAVREFEFDLRREYQDKAIVSCYQIYQELQYIAESFCTDLNKMVRLLHVVEKEIDLLKGWRQSDNKRRKK